jgi:hypothetical protein
MGPVYPIQQTAEAWNELQGKPASKVKKNGRMVLVIR